ncbi:hypothetical protein ACFLX8_05050 [Chloroflexota bacterium]
MENREVHIEGCPLQHERPHKAGDCRICPQADGCIFLAILNKLGSIEHSIRELSEKQKT